MAIAALAVGGALYAQGLEYPDVIGGRGGIYIAAPMILGWTLGPMVLALLVVVIRRHEDLSRIPGSIIVLCVCAIAAISLGESIFVLNAEIGLFNPQPSGLTEGNRHKAFQLSLLVPMILARTFDPNRRRARV